MLFNELEDLKHNYIVEGRQYFLQKISEIIQHKWIREIRFSHLYQSKNKKTKMLESFDNIILEVEVYKDSNKVIRAGIQELINQLELEMNNHLDIITELFGTNNRIIIKKDGIYDRNGLLYTLLT